MHSGSSASLYECKTRIDFIFNVIIQYLSNHRELGSIDNVLIQLLLWAYTLVNKSN